MKITIESTTKIVNANGVDCRIWEGTTERGIKVVCLIPRIAAVAGQDLSDFDRDLAEQREPTFLADAYPAKMIL